MAWATSLTCKVVVQMKMTNVKISSRIWWAVELVSTLWCNDADRPLDGDEAQLNFSWGFF